jgi:hypothetical protein
MEATQRRPPAYMTLAEDPLGHIVAADWIGKFVMLGRLAARWSRAHADSQLVVVLSVPARDFAAVLVGCGWMTATAAPSIPPVREVLADLPLHAPVRVVTPSKVLAEHFGGVNVAKDRARFGTDWQIDKLRAVVPLWSLDTPCSQPIPEPAALQLMGPQATAVVASQAGWKGALQARLDQLGRAAVIHELAAVGVRTLDRVAAWTEPMLARPRRNQDFEALLQWLGVKVHPTYELATALRRKRAQASAKIGDQLEEAVAAANMSLLERDGHLRLELKSEGFRGVIATRVLSISPYVEIISRHDARELRPDRSAKWLE